MCWLHRNCTSVIISVYIISIKDKLTPFYSMQLQKYMRSSYLSPILIPIRPIIDHRSPSYFVISAVSKSWSAFLFGTACLCKLTRYSSMGQSTYPATPYLIGLTGPMSPCETAPCCFTSRHILLVFLSRRPKINSNQFKQKETLTSGSLHISDKISTSSMYHLKPQVFHLASTRNTNKLSRNRVAERKHVSRSDYHAHPYKHLPPLKE